MGIQELCDALSNAMRDTRKRYHLTLGQLIEQLQRCDPDMSVRFDVSGRPGLFDSYRGYYADLSIAPTRNQVTVQTLLSEAVRALGATFTGYKGGEYVMGADTPLWMAEYGDCGRAVIAADIRDGELWLITKADAD